MADEVPNENDEQLAARIKGGDGEALRTVLRVHGGKVRGWLGKTYDELCESVRKDRALAEAQLRDYEARLGRTFAHAAYLEELTALRDRLKLALSGTPAEGEPTAAELAERITALKAAHAVEAAPARVRKAVKPEASKPVGPVKGDAHEQAPPPGEDPPPSDDGKPALSFRAKVKPTGTQLRLF